MEPRRRPELVSMSAIGQCIRQQWMQFHDYEETHPPHGRQARTLDFGHYVEEAVVKWLQESGYEVIFLDPDGKQFQIKGTHSIGHIDGFIKYKGRWIPFDVKGPQSGWARQKADSFAGFEGWVYSLGHRVRDIIDILVIDSPHEGGVKVAEPHYYDQAHMYMAYGPHSEIPIDGIEIDWEHFLFIVMDKGTQKMLLEEIEFDDVHAAALKMRESSIFQLGMSEEEPDIPSGFTADKFPCSWSGGEYGCSFRGHCW